MSCGAIEEKRKILLEGMSRSTVPGERQNSSCGISVKDVVKKSAVSVTKKDDESFTSDISDDSPPLDIGDTATIRFLKARNKILSQEVRRCRASSDEAVMEILDLRKQLHRAAEETETAVKQLARENTKVEKMNKAKEANENMTAHAQSSLAEIQKELCKLNNIAKEATHGKDIAEVCRRSMANMRRAVEEANQTKAALHKALSTSSEVERVERVGKNEIGALKKQVHQLEQQKQELISIFKKQLKLIDTLKRQKVHAEAAHLLTFTEKDFMDTLDWAASIREVPRT